MEDSTVEKEEDGGEGDEERRLLHKDAEQRRLLPSFSSSSSLLLLFPFHARRVINLIGPIISLELPKVIHGQRIPTKDEEGGDGGRRRS